MKKINAFFQVSFKGSDTVLMTRDLFNTEEYIDVNKRYHGDFDEFVEDTKKTEHYRKTSETLYFENIGIARLVHSSLPIAPKE